MACCWLGASKSARWWRYAQTLRRLSANRIWVERHSDASLLFARGNIRERPAFPLATAVEIAPRTPRISPDSANSPTNSWSLRCSDGTCSEAAKIPRAIAKSKRPPSLGKSAGARFTVMRR